MISGGTEVNQFTSIHLLKLKFDKDPSHISIDHSNRKWKTIFDGKNNSRFQVYNFRKSCFNKHCQDNELRVFDHFVGLVHKGLN